MSKIHRITIVVFLLLIYLPMVIMFITPDQQNSISENRPLARGLEFQTNTNRSISMRDTLTALEMYVNDHFGMRNVLTSLQGTLFFRILGKSPSERVIVGKDNWLFYASAASEYSIEDYRGLIRLSKEYLQEAASFLQSRKDWLNQQGIDYLFVIAPDKHTIYPEYIPERYTVFNTERRIDQFLYYIREYTDVEVLDLRQPMLDAKAQGVQVYFQYDTHWSAAGALMGYRAIVSHFGITPHESWRIVEGQYSGDLGRMMGLELSEAYQQYHPLSPCAVRQEITVPETLPYWVELYDFHCNTLETRALIFHDSFVDLIRPHLAEHFNRTLFVKARYEDALAQPLVEWVKPDIVIEEIVERRLHSYFDYDGTLSLQNE